MPRANFTSSSTPRYGRLPLGCVDGGRGLRVCAGQTRGFLVMTSSSRGMVLRAKHQDAWVAGEESERDDNVVVRTGTKECVQEEAGREKGEGWREGWVHADTPQNVWECILRWYRRTCLCARGRRAFGTAHSHAHAHTHAHTSTHARRTATLCLGRHGRCSLQTCLPPSQRRCLCRRPRLLPLLAVHTDVLASSSVSEEARMCGEARIPV